MSQNNQTNHVNKGGIDNYITPCVKTSPGWRVQSKHRAERFLLQCMYQPRASDRPGLCKDSEGRGRGNVAGLRGQV